MTIRKTASSSSEEIRIVPAVFPPGYAVTHRVLDKRLQRERRKAEIRRPNVVLGADDAREPLLLEREIISGVVQFLTEADRPAASEGVYVAAQILGEFDDGLFRSGALPWHRSCIAVSALKRKCGWSWLIITDVRDSVSSLSLLASWCSLSR
jgi:hypothetical protein